MRRFVWILSCGAAIFVATVVAASQREAGADRGGATPYTPTRGEWMCLLLNSRQAVANSQRSGGLAVRYVYDLSKPDTVCIEILYGEGTTSDDQLHLCAARAEHHAVEAAKVYGWQDWLKIEHRERKVTDMFASDELIRP